MKPADQKPPKTSAGENPAKLTKAEWRAFRAAIDEGWELQRQAKRPERSISPERSAVLNTTGLKPNRVIPDADALKVRNTLRLPLDKWNNAKVRSVNELGQLQYMRLCARVLLVEGFDSIQQIGVAMKVGKEIMEDPNADKEHRVMAGNMIAKCGQTYAELSEQLLELAEKGSDLAPATAGEKPKNLPPPIAVQFNFARPSDYAGRIIEVSSPSAETGQPDPK